MLVPRTVYIYVHRYHITKLGTKGRGKLSSFINNPFAISPRTPFGTNPPIMGRLQLPSPLSSNPGRTGVCSPCAAIHLIWHARGWHDQTRRLHDQVQSAKRAACENSHALPQRPTQPKLPIHSARDCRSACSTPAAIQPIWHAREWHDQTGRPHDYVQDASRAACEYSHAPPKIQNQPKLPTHPAISTAVSLV